MSDITLDEADCVEYIVNFGGDGVEYLEGVVGEECPEEEAAAGGSIGVGEVVGGATFCFYGWVYDFVVEEFALVRVPSFVFL